MARMSSKRDYITMMMLLIACSKMVQSNLIVLVEDTEVKVGDSAFLNCSTDIVSKEIQWYHYPIGVARDQPRSYVYAWRDVHQPYIGRFELQRLDENSSIAYNLIIHNVTREDAGLYVCWDSAGVGQHSSAEVIVLESDPVCGSNVGLGEVIGENSCGVKPDDLEFSCTIAYKGNRPPSMEWRNKEGLDPITRGVLHRNSTSNITSVLRMTSEVALSGSSFVCQTTKHPLHNQYNCTMQVTRILYAFEKRQEQNVTLTDEVRCLANSSSDVCSYSWFNDRSELISIGQNLTASRLGSHECRADCRLRQEECQIVAMQIYVYVHPRQIEEPVASLLPLLLIVVVVFAVAVILSLFLWRRHKRNIEKRIGTIQQHLYTTYPEKVVYRDNPSLVHTILARPEQPQKIRGVTVLGSNIFVVRCRSQEIEVYECISFTESRHFDVHGLVDPWDIVSCLLNNCLYIMDGKDPRSVKEIIRMAPSGDVLRDWKTKQDAGYLSVTKEGNILLAVYRKNVLKEFSPKGELMMKVKVQPTSGRIIHPHHAFRLLTGHYLVIHGIGDSLHRVCIVDDQGGFVKSFGGKKGSDNGTMNLPKYLAVDRAGSIMVLDQNNNRVLLLNFDLQLQKELIPRDRGLVSACRIHLDEDRGRLYVVQDESIQVFNVLHEQEDVVRQWDIIV